MKQALSSILALSIALTSVPAGIAPAQAGPLGRDLGFSGKPSPRPQSGARTRPAATPKVKLPARPAGGGQAQVKPSVPQTRPAAPATAEARPAAPAGQPAQRPARPPAAEAPAQTPAQRPSMPRPALPGSEAPAVRPAPGGGSARPALPQAGVETADRRPPGTRPPGSRPPGGKPPGAGHPPGKPPGWHPPHHRPPGWRPPYHRPPYHRPPHHHWGDYHWHPAWGWFFTAVIVGSTLAFVTSIDDGSCEEIRDGGETLYLCDGVLYRSTYYQEQTVYEIVSDPPEEQAKLTTVVGLAVTDPLTQGQLVRDLQNRLIGAGYDAGTTDGIYGSSTRAAVEWLQYDNELPVTGVVDAETAKLLNF